MISFRCGRCTDWIKAEDAEAGRGVTCRRCQHVNVCPSASIAPSPRPARASAPAAPWAWVAAAVIVLAVTVWFIWPLVGGSDASAAPASTSTPADALQQQLLRENVGKPGDPILNQLYGDLRSRHFNGSTLPVIQVLWEPRLADVGKLASSAFTLEGMFGHAGRQSVILLNPNLQSDRKALLRALSHEMAHAYLFSTGDSTSDHGPAFQAVLSRLADEGAFEGIVSSDDDRKRLRAWIDEESARLDAEHVDFERAAGDVERDRVDVERALADINARVSAANAAGQGWPAQTDVADVTARRDAYNQRAIDANERAQRDRTDIEHFNREVARYNLMLVYPDGLDQSALAKTKAIK